MPPLAVAIPVISRSEQNHHRTSNNLNIPKQPSQKPRTYDDGPLPIKPSETSPKQARIISRNEDKYDLRIGNVDITDVSIEDVLNYVSPMDLEQFENRNFVEERTVLNVIAADRAQRKREKLERQKERAKTKGVAIFEEVDSVDESTEGGEVTVGKHGRARPTYTHLFKRPAMREKDADTDDVISVGEVENGGLSTENEPALIPATKSSIPAAELPKRQRRKRDKVTGELLPLSPMEQKLNEARRTDGEKRPRRKRHPLTRELMPLGWRYDPEDGQDSYEKRRQGVGSHSFRHLSTSEEPSVKRQRLDLQSSVSRSPSPLPTKAELAAQHTPLKPGSELKPKTQLRRKVDYDLISSEDEVSGAIPTSSTPSNLKPPPKPAKATPRPINKRPMSSADSTSMQESSPEPVGRTSIMQPSASKVSNSLIADVAKTSILNPSFSRASSTEPPEDDEISEEDLDEGEWFIESVLDHQMSNPKTHPHGFGTEPVMLYLVKWEGFDEPTWEPIESFGDPSVVRAYRSQAGLDSESSEEETMLAADSVDPPKQSRANQRKTSISKDESDESDEGHEEQDDGDENMDEDEFEVEAILDHVFSDPQTHPKGLGRTPVVLYKVKWKGWPIEKATWEPASSFEDKDALSKYHGRVGR